MYLVDTIAQRSPVDVIAAHEVSTSTLERSFNVRLEGPQFIADRRCDPPPPLPARIPAALQARRVRRDYSEMTGSYDLVFGHTIGLPWQSGARRSVLICHFPTVRRDRLWPGVPSRGARSLLTAAGREQRDVRARVGSWSRIVVSSNFARRWVHTYWDREAEVIYPPIEQPTRVDLGTKKPWIIGAGYFARPSEPGDPWGYKRQEILIDMFRQLCDAGLKGWELHLAGHVLLAPPDDEKYLNELRARAPGYPIVFHTNCSHSELLELYRGGSLFWHAAGYKMDQEAFPDRMEHFGMVTAEAMGYGCVPVVINKGGQPEIVEAGASGVLWDEPSGCVETSLELAGHPDAMRSLAENAVRRAEHFSVGRFRERVNTLFDQELRYMGAR